MNYSAWGNPEADKLDAQIANYDAKLKKIYQDRADADKKAKRDEKARENQHNQEMLELRQKADADYEGTLIKTGSNRRALLQKEADQSTAVQKRALDENLISVEEFEKRKDAIQKRLREEVRKLSGSGSGGSKGTGKGADDTDWANLAAKLEQLKTGVKSGADMSTQIEKIGKAAQKSASEIEAMKQAFIRTIDKKNWEELNRELLQAQGNTAKLNEIENAEKLTSFKAKLADIQSYNQAEKDSLAIQYESALARQTHIKDLQTNLDFLKELQGLGGSYNLTIDTQNQLLAYQAEIYRSQLDPSM